MEAFGIKHIPNPESDQDRITNEIYDGLLLMSTLSNSITRRTAYDALSAQRSLVAQWQRVSSLLINNNEEADTAIEAIREKLESHPLFLALLQIHHLKPTNEKN